MTLNFVWTLLFALVAVLPGTTVLSAEEEPVGGATNESGQAQAADAETLVVKLQAGAESPRAAVSAFAAASNAGDVEAALLLIDPCVRPLLQAEVLLEEYQIEIFLLRNILMSGKEQMSPLNNLGAIPLVYAKSDVVRSSQIDILKEQPSTAGNDRVLFDVEWKAHSWSPSHEQRQFDCITVTVMAVRRGHRWYLFHPFGAVSRALVYSDEFGYEAAGRKEAELRIGNANTVLRNERRQRPDLEWCSVAFIVTYQVPIEVVHEELVLAAQSAEVAELVKQTQNLIRFKNRLRNQVFRGDFPDLAALDKVLDAEASPVFESLVHRYYVSYEPAVNRLLRRLPQEPPANKPSQTLRRGGNSQVTERPSVARPCNSRLMTPNLEIGPQIRSKTIRSSLD